MDNQNKQNKNIFQVSGGNTFPPTEPGPEAEPYELYTTVEVAVVNIWNGMILPMSEDTAILAVKRKSQISYHLS